MYKRMFAQVICLCLLLALPYSSKAINISAESAVVIEMERGDIVYEKNSRIRMPMASTTKIMTALIAVESGRLDETVTVTDEMIGAEGSSIYLKSGEKLKLRELVYALMLASANDAAEAIALYLGSSIEAFADIMNKRAVALGLRDTSFANPHGLDDEDHYTTAYDLAMLTCAAMKNETFREIVSCRQYTLQETELSPTRCLANHNKMLRLYDGAIGVKTGFTKKCGRCLVSAAERNGVGIIAVTLSAPDDWNDHCALLDLGFETVKSVCLAGVGSLRYKLPVIADGSTSVTIANKDSLTLPIIKNGTAVETKLECIGGRYLFTPIEAGQHLADAVFYIDGEEIARLPLYAEQTVKAPESKSGIFDFFIK